jgi:hypothetical protein
MDIHVNNAGELINAFRDATASDTILIESTIPLPSQQYKSAAPLFVSDDVTLQGAGRMELVEGLPDRLDTPTTITAKPGLKGNLVTLGNDSYLRGLVLHGDSQAHFEDDDGRGGNTVAVASRRPHDMVSATIVECELHNQITTPGGPDGPAGGAILVYTRNPKQGADPRPHEYAQVTLALTQSIVDTPNDGKAVFAMNFASHGQVIINLHQNLIGGSLDVIGGLARPDAVENATTTVNSRGNHYSPHQAGSHAAGWQIIGGSSPPPLAGPPAVGSTKADSNIANANSTDDQIEDFQVGIVAIGGRRLDSEHGPCSNNVVNLTLTRTKLTTNRNAADATDFEFAGAESFGPFSAGDNNVVIVDVLKGTTPDPLFHINVHGAVSGPGGPPSRELSLRARLPRQNP